MKRIIALMIVLVFALSLAACGEANKNVDKNDTSSYVGTWKTSKDYTLTINEDGTGEYKKVESHLFESMTMAYPLTYEVKDGLIYLTINSLVSSFELSDNGKTLTPIENNLPVRESGDTEFRKK